MVLNFGDFTSVEAQKSGSGIGQEDGRMGRDDELGVAGRFQIVDDLEQRELPLGRKGGFGLIEDVETLFKPVFKEGEEGFAVRLFV